ncbi:unnamed protein product, partial [Brugia timori]|uniref:Phospholip_A2_4 domain-containing protein n=1 Tax=Brugia timori TaxID=42155 RepID=A0A0R3QFJ0_9BILA
MLATGLYLNKDKILEKVIDKLPFELHWPGYQYLGPGTKLDKRVKRGDKGINPLDQAAKQHDIAYASSSNLGDRLKADQTLENQAWNRVKSGDASFFQEKVPAYITTNLMKAKRMLGAGLKLKKKKAEKYRKIERIVGGGMKTRKPRGKKKNRGKLSFNSLLRTAQQQINPDQSLSDNTSKMMAALRKLKKNKTITNAKRVLTVPKQGGALPILPILGALNTIKKVGQSIGAIVSAATAINEARKELFGNKRGKGYVNINRTLALHKKDTILGYGTHWVATRKAGFRVIYFDSYGNIPPPVEIVRYYR